MDSTPETYVCFASGTLWGIHLILFARPHIAEDISGLQVSGIPFEFRRSIPPLDHRFLRKTGFNRSDWDRRCYGQQRRCCCWVYLQRNDPIGVCRRAFGRSSDKARNLFLLFKSSTPRLALCLSASRFSGFRGADCPNEQQITRKSSEM
jgi:hypothetical protein